MTFFRFRDFCVCENTKITSNFRAHSYVCERSESNGDKLAELDSAFDLETPDQLPVKEFDLENANS